MPNPKPEEAMASKKRPEDVTVLVVDDEVDIAVYLASVLEDAGMNVVVAHDGMQALEVIRRQPIDLISLDLVMPRKSGIRLLMDLRKDRDLSRIPVVIVTAHARDAGVRKDLDEALAESTMTGPSMYLEKPVTPTRYLRGISEILGVAIGTDGVDGDDSQESMREEARMLLNNIDTATLQEVVDQLRKAGK
jgi:CheY-like chemotaxis protein